MQHLNKLFVAALVVALPHLSFAEKLEVDPNHSSINFEATHLKISKIPGRFTEFAGSLDYDEKDVKKSKVDFTVQIGSITTAVSKRDDHLKSADFFDAQKFPQATFSSTSIKKAAGGYSLEGDLTIRGVTKKVTFAVKSLGKAQDPTMNVQKTVFRATGKINRKDFGVSYGPDAVVSDNIDLVINLETMLPAAPAK